MSEIPTIAEVLHYAADNVLAARWSQFGNQHHKEYSCDCIDYAIWKLRNNSMNLFVRLDFSERVRHGLKELGLNTMLMNQFNEFQTIEERQQARYNWLKFAALIAEEQGV